MNDNKIILLYDHRSKDTRPLPERIIDDVGGTMDYIDLTSGIRVYSVRDWVYWVSGSASKQKHTAWADLKRSLLKRGGEKVVDKVHTLKIDTAGGKQETDFANENTLYLITQRMSDKSKMVRAVKQYLADAGVYLDAMARNIRFHQKRGFADSWIAERIQGTVDRNRFTDALRRALLNYDPKIFGHATEEMYKVLWERTTEQLKNDLGIKTDETPRNYMGELALIYTRITERVCAKRLNDRVQVPYWLAIEIVKEVAQIFHRQAKETSEALGIDLVTNRPLLPSGNNDNIA